MTFKFTKKHRDLKLFRLFSFAQFIAKLKQKNATSHYDNLANNVIC